MGNPSLGEVPLLSVVAFGQCAKRAGPLREMGSNSLRVQNPEGLQGQPGPRRLELWIFLGLLLTVGGFLSILCFLRLGWFRTLLSTVLRDCGHFWGSVLVVSSSEGRANGYSQGFLGPFGRWEQGG